MSKQKNNIISKLPVLDVECVGCSACCDICPTQALEMGMDQEGFYRPSFNIEKCIDCKKCLHVCKENYKNEKN